jgi:predicted RNase H-like nuclease (RuvC/YqgF family)
VLIIHFL